MKASVLTRYDITDSGCWVWSGAKDPNGYGVINLGSRLDRAHRVFWENYCGPIPQGLVIDHLCRNPSCVNPEHLEPVTQKVNIQRATFPNSLKTECPAGHPYAGDNLKINSRGSRVCVVCDRRKQAAYRERKRERCRIQE